MDAWEQVCCNSGGTVSLGVGEGPWVPLTINSSFNSGEMSGLESGRKSQKSGFSNNRAALVSFYPWLEVRRVWWLILSHSPCFSPFRHHPVTLPSDVDSSEESHFPIQPMSCLALWVLDRPVSSKKEPPCPVLHRP